MEFAKFSKLLPCFAMLFATPALAAAPDWTGVYTMAGFMSNDNLDGFKPLNPDLSSVATAHLKPWAVQKMNDTDTEADDLGAICSFAGLFRHPPTVAGYMWLQKPGWVYLVSTDLRQVGVRRIKLTDHHSANIAPTWDGESIGHWEGDTLVVDTIGFNDKSWLMSDMQPHSEELHLIERIRRVDHGKLLEFTSTVEDREALRSPYSWSRYYVYRDQDYDDSEGCSDSTYEQKRWNDIRKDAITRDQQKADSQPDAAKLQP